VRLDQRGQGHSPDPGLVRRLVISGANARGDFYGLLAYLRFCFSDQQFAAGAREFLEDQPPL